MKTVVLTFMLIAVSVCFAEENKAKKFSNVKYGYSFLYPDYLEVRLTGKKEKRDGRSVAIYCFEYTNPTPCLQIIVFPDNSSEKEKLLKIKKALKEISQKDSQFFIKSRNIKVNKKNIRVDEFYFTKTNNIFMTECFINGVTFKYMSSTNGEKLDTTDWFQIVTTFKINKKANLKNK
ncbi:MAG: hypothetical protein KOO69_02560 [Victivallales bacterium]|nr:hypothetical protein [Victivallales bacterium]